MNWWDNTSYNGKARQPLTLKAQRVSQGGTTVIVSMLTTMPVLVCLHEKSSDPNHSNVHDNF